MNRLLPYSFAKQLRIFHEKSVVNGSHFTSTQTLDIFVGNGVLVRQITGRRRSKIHCPSIENLENFLLNSYGISNLEEYILLDSETERSKATQIASNSKLSSKTRLTKS